MAVHLNSVDIVKGWTRATSVVWIMLAVSELDPSEESTKAFVKPLEKVLDRAWLLPMHVVIGMSKDQQSFRNMSLSFRGAERQSPSVLQMALRFSVIMERQATTMSGNTESRLKKVIKQFNESDGLHVKHQVDSEKERTILNLIVGTCKATRDVMSQHLAFAKWRESAFSTDLLKGSRWLLGARPKGLPESLHEALVVTPESQTMLMQLHVKRFLQATRRVKPTQRGRARISPEEFDRLVDYSCMFAFLRQSAKTATSDPKVDEKLLEAFMARCLVGVWDYFQDIEAVVTSKNPSFQLRSLIVWSDLVEPPMLPASLQGEESVDVLAAQEQASAAKFAEIKVKLAADCKAMNAFNSEKSQVAGKQHVTKVLHEKAQNETGSKVVMDFMQNHCWMGLVADWSMPAEVDVMLRATAARNQVALEKVNVIGWVDLTKIGVVTQKDINKVGQWCEKLIAKNPLCTCVVMALPLLASALGCGALRTDIRKLEDKLNDYKIEFRSGVEMKATVVVNSTAYDGCLEKVCVGKGLPCVSQSEKQTHFTMSLKLTKSALLDQWKKGSGAMADRLPRYISEPNAEVMPSDPAEPTLTVCSMVDGTLCLPRNIRSEFLSDPIRGPEWRKILQEFDRCFGTSAPVPAGPSVTEAGGAGSGEPEPAPQNATPGFDWETAFDEPRAAEQWHTKYDGLIQGKFSWCPELTAYIVGDGQSSESDAPPKFKLFIEAHEAYTLPADEAFLTYGAGTWLLDSKAESFLSENSEHGHKAVECKFQSDLVPVVLEEGGHDGDLKTLRGVIQQCEAAGMVDFELGGHSFSRPAAVVQGKSGDQFDVGLKPGSCMVWRPNNLQISGLRATNAASFFLSSLLEASSTLKKVWRLRAYKPEKTLGAAKPMWFLTTTLNMAKGSVQRVV
ncbi:Uncharacterized protein SCF082_LOCUS619 [Durusdinium trenchii]|uniref:Uncharacterized protein n=1 Tax=Durusdinium trenchii TaxID=1381693 RepID=A0ABP0H9Z7_9DINO